MNAKELSGRALDAAVARHAFGLEVEERTNARTKEQDFVCREPGQDWLRVAFYSSLSASLTLESKLRDLGWTVKRSPLGQLTEPSGRIAVTLERGAAQVEASGASFEEALARASLKVTDGFKSGSGWMSAD